MRPAQQIWKGRKVKIRILTPTELNKNIHDGITQRAFLIYQSRGCMPGQELEDWCRAEREAVKPLSCGLVRLNDKLSTNLDASFFQEGEIDIFVEPQRLAVCGKERAPKTEPMPKAGEPAPRVFRLLEFPVEIDRARITARFKGPSLEIDLPNAPAVQNACSAARAA